MVVGIVSISLAAVIAIIYVIIRLKIGCVWGTFMALIADFAYIAAAILSLLVSTNINNIVYASLLLALTVSFVGDVLVEFKDHQKQSDSYLNLGMMMFALHKILNFVALVTLVSASINWVPFTISAAIALAATTLLMTLTKFAKLDFRYFFLQICCYFLIMTYLVTLSVWYAILLPQLLLFTISIGLFFISDVTLLWVHLGEQKVKTHFFIWHNLFYFSAQLVMVSFLYFGFFTNF